MNSITRLILRRVASGNVQLTPRLLQVLKELNQTHPQAESPEASASEPATVPKLSDGKSPPEVKRLTFLNPLPGRWIRRMDCGIGIVLLLAASLTQAANNPTTFEMANYNFSRGNYSDAVHGYQSIIAQSGYSAPVLFNLANALQRGGQLGEAILNYERAGLLSPNDPDIAVNLNVACQNAGIEPERPSEIQMAARTLTMNLWFVAAAAALSLLTVTLPLKHLWRGAYRALNFGGVTATVVLGIAVAALVSRGTELHRAVATAPETIIAGVSPVTTAEPVFKLRAGEDISLQQIHGTFALVRNHAGQQGWVKTGDIAPVIPPPDTIHKS